jgi:hypothetical protein
LAPNEVVPSFPPSALAIESSTCASVGAETIIRADEAPQV